MECARRVGRLYRGADNGPNGFTPRSYSHDRARVGTVSAPRRGRPSGPANCPSLRFGSRNAAT